MKTGSLQNGVSMMTTLHKITQQMLRNEVMRNHVNMNALILGDSYYIYVRYHWHCRTAVGDIGQCEREHEQGRAIYGYLTITAIRRTFNVMLIRRDHYTDFHSLNIVKIN